MKVHQIVSERTESLNEAVPLVIAGIGIGTIITAISVGMSAWSAYEIYKFIGKYNQDPEAITDDEWNDLFIDAVLLFTPGFAKYGKAGILKLIPKSWQFRGGKWMKKTVMERLAKLKQTSKAIEKINLKKYDPNSKVGWEKIKAYLKMRGANSAMKAAAQARMGFIPDVVMTVLKTVVGLEFIRQYYEDLSVLEQDYKDYKAGKGNWGDISEQEAYDSYQTLRKKLLGELTIGIALNTGVASKAFGAMSSMFGGITNMAARASGTGYATAEILGKIVSIPTNMLKGISKLIEMGPAAPAFLIFMRTESGKEFLNSTLARMITEPTGALTATAIDLLEQGLQAAGLLDGKLPGKTAVEPPTGDAADGPRQATNSGMPIQWVGKKLYVYDVQISDENGYRIIGNAKLADIKRDAAALKIPDPTLKIQDDPKKKYGVYGYDEIK